MCVVINCIRNDGGINKVTFVRMTDKNLLPFLTRLPSWLKATRRKWSNTVLSFTPQRGSNTVKNWNIKYRRLNQIRTSARIQRKAHASIHTCTVVWHSHTALFYIFRVRQASLGVILINSGLTHKRMKATWDWPRMRVCVISAIVWRTMANQWTQWNKEKH